MRCDRCSIGPSGLWSGWWPRNVFTPYLSMNGFGTFISFLLPRTAAMPRGHVISDLYRRARNLLRSARVLRNPTAAERADVAGRLRAEWRP